MPCVIIYKLQEAIQRAENLGEVVGILAIGAFVLLVYTEWKKRGW